MNDIRVGSCCIRHIHSWCGTLVQAQVAEYVSSRCGILELIGASLSEPHTDEIVCALVYVCIEWHYAYSKSTFLQITEFLASFI